MALMAARLAVTVQSGNAASWAPWAAWGPVGPSELNQARWPADLLVRAEGPGERGRPAREESQETHLPMTQ